MNIKTLIVALAMLLVIVGTIFAVHAATEEDDITVETCDSDDPIEGCDNFCAWCLPVNGDGACYLGGGCC